MKLPFVGIFYIPDRPSESLPFQYTGYLIKRPALLCLWGSLRPVLYITFTPSLYKIPNLSMRAQAIQILHIIALAAIPLVSAQNEAADYGRGPEIPIHRHAWPKLWFYSGQSSFTVTHSKYKYHIAIVISKCNTALTC